MTHVVVIGAGSVGVACASSMLASGLPRRLTLADLDHAKAEGEALDFAHAAPMLGGATVDAMPLAEVSGGELCVITAGAKQRPGESRLDLRTRNEEALDRIAERLEAGGLPRVCLVVTNPVDLATERLRRRWEGRVHVLGTGTVLDTMRLRGLLSRRLAVSAESVHAWVVGEHGDSSVCLLDSARVAGVPLATFLERRGQALDEALRTSIESEVRGAAYRVIERKGATSHAIGVVVARIARAIARDERSVLPVTVPVEPGVSFGAPAVVGRNGAEPAGPPELSPREKAAWDASLGALRAANAR